MTRDMAASVRQRLLNRAQAERRQFNELLQRYVLERFLYRLAESPYARQFVLKGAMMLLAWHGPAARPTRDIDLLGRMDSSIEHLVDVMRAVCQAGVPDDGVQFDSEHIQGEAITEDADYQGVRVSLLARVGAARIYLHVDVGFGDIVVPRAEKVELPTLLDLPAPVLQGYSRESAIAEKLHAMVQRGALNSRMKDFYDIWSLASRFDFDGPTLVRAIQATFGHRQRRLPTNIPALTPEFALAADKQAQWKAFVRRQPLPHEIPAFEEVVLMLAEFLQPATGAAYENVVFDKHWPPGGPWRNTQGNGQYERRA